MNLTLHRKLCSTTIQSLFKNEGKHGGEATIESVQLIADLVKIRNCQLHPESIEVGVVSTYIACLILLNSWNFFVV